MNILSAKSRGFTLIELLIVIALLGALALGLIATIDPFEQLKKGRDTSQRNVTAETYNAFLRYYSTKGKFTWATSSSFTNTLNSMGTDVTELINAGELKARFMELAGTSNLSKIFVTSTAVEHVASCFKPESKAFQKEPNTFYASDGQTSSVTCKSQTSGTGGTDCYYCFQ